MSILDSLRRAGKQEPSKKKENKQEQQSQNAFAKVGANVDVLASVINGVVAGFYKTNSPRKFKLDIQVLDTHEDASVSASNVFDADGEPGHQVDIAIESLSNKTANVIAHGVKSALNPVLRGAASVYRDDIAAGNQFNVTVKSAAHVSTAHLSQAQAAINHAPSNAPADESSVNNNTPDYSGPGAGGPGR